MEARFLTVSEVAEELSCSYRTVLRRIADGSIATFRDGGIVRVPEKALADYVRARTHSAPPRTSAPPSRSGARPRQEFAEDRESLWSMADPLPTH
jgi:excisionase family DNA binding protein